MSQPALGERGEQEEGLCQTAFSVLLATDLYIGEPTQLRALCQCCVPLHVLCRAQLKSRKCMLSTFVFLKEPTSSCLPHMQIVEVGKSTYGGVLQCSSQHTQQV